MMRTILLAIAAFSMMSCAAKGLKFSTHQERYNSAETLTIALAGSVETWLSTQSQNQLNTATQIGELMDTLATTIDQAARYTNGQPLDRSSIAIALQSVWTQLRTVLLKNGINVPIQAEQWIQAALFMMEGDTGAVIAENNLPPIIDIRTRPKCSYRDRFISALRAK